MKKRQFVAAMMAGMMACSLLTACGDSSSQSQDSQSTSSSSDTQKADQPSTAAEDKAADSGDSAQEGTQELSVTTWDNESSPQFQAIVDAYEEKNPNVKIKIIDTSADEYNNSLGISLSAAQPDPDVIWVKDMGSMLQMADKEQLLPIDDFIARDSLDLSIYKGAAEQLMYNDKSYALPYRNDWYVLYYNKDLFDAAGGSILPTT